VDPAALAAAMQRQIGEEARELVKTVGERLIERGERKGRQEGLELGRQEGLELGREEGLAFLRQALLRQLGQRFGQVSERARKRIATAPAAQLARWAGRVVAASSIQEVLRP
jgi:flagellar biosynthesis/type III secretory pathway protein FliH